MMDWMDRLRDFSFGSMVLRLALAMICGGVLGHGRSRMERPAGLRTYMLACMAATMSVLLALYEYQMLQGPWQAAAGKFDVGRIAAQTISGIGYIGAGIIIKISHSQVKGLTTATGMFAAVCLGLACGIGFYECVIPALILVGLVLNVMSPLEGAFKRKLRNMTLNVEFREAGDISTIQETLEKLNAVVYDIEVERAESTGDHHASAVFVLKMSRDMHSHSGLLTSVAELSCVHAVSEILA